MPSYNPAEVEPRQQAAWDRTSAFRTVDPSDPSVAGKPKYYILDMFPYPSGTGLHVGHPEGYTATDILARFKRMNGFHVLHPMGWDAFGLPAEEFARKTGTHPRLTTAKSIENFRRQIKSLGFSYDWQREVDTTDPNYVRWTQWIFLLLYDTWYDPVAQKGKTIAELPIPEAIRAAGEGAIRKYQDDRRLAYQAEVLVNWCPELGTVLANEEVVDGVSERGGHPVDRRPLRQWLMRITAYAERLLADLDGLDWSESIKSMQRNWIGKSEGAEIDFGIEGSSEKLRVFTTRPDTLFGATYMVLAPELSIVDTIATPEQRAAITTYREETSRKSDFERTEGNKKKKSGVFTGAYALNPVNGAKVPIWIADYVLATYGTGAIMSVPGHDERDFEFAKRYELPIVPVVRPESGMVDLTEAFTEAGIAVNSGFLDGLPTLKAKETMIAHLERENLGLRRVNYKLRDWLFSRQRYWGEPFPILHELGPDGKPSGVIKTLDPSELPLTLPEMQDFNPTGSPEGPLAKATEWVEIERDGKRYRRETNTMPQWAGSCWYFLRYIDPTNEEVFADPKKLAHWLPVDLYVGGAEHAVLHLLYSRFWFKVLFDRGYVPCTEPFQKLVNQGMILGEVEYHVPESGYKANEAKIKELGVEGAYVPSDDDKESTYALKLPTPHPEQKVNLPDDWLKKQEGKTYLKDKSTGIVLTGRADKMSKSRGNVVNPDDIIGEYGADSLRLYEMFMGPLEATKPWSTKSVEGVHRFLARVWRLIVDDRAEQLTLAAEVQEIPADAETLRRLHKTIRKITEDTEGLRFNTAIAAMMEFTNFLTQQKVRAKSVLETFVLLLAPYAPHIAEELWSALGRTDSLAVATWPKFDPALTVDEAIEIPVQVNGKVKTKLQVAAEIADSDLEAAALADEKVREAIGGKPVKLVKVVPKRLVNIVIG